jgi:uncharacterized membrane protein
MYIFSKIKKNKYWSTIILVGCFLLATALRVHHIALRPFWLDEAHTANLLPSASLAFAVQTDSCPAYFILMQGWSSFFDNSELSLRLLSTIFSLFSIFAIYLLGKQLFSRKIGLWCAFLLAINYFSIFYAIQSRQYSLIILISALSSFFLAKFLKEQKKSQLVLYAFFLTFGIYLHPWMLLVAGGHFLWVVMTKKTSLKIFSLAGFFIFLATIPYLQKLLAFKNAGVNDWISPPTLITFKETFHYFVYGSGWLYLLLGIITLFATFFAFKKTEQLEKISYSIEENKFNAENIFGFYFILTCLFLPIISAWIISQFFPFYVPGRYEAPVLPAFILLCAFLFSQFKSEKTIALTVSLLLLFSYYSVDADKKSIALLKVNDRTVTEKIVATATTGDTIIFTGLSRPSFDYYLPRVSLENKEFNLIYFPGEMAMHPATQSIRELLKKKPAIETEANNLAQTLKNKKNTSSIWVLYNLNNPISEILLEALKRDFSLKEKISLYHSHLFPNDASAVAPLHFQEILRFE